MCQKIVFYCVVSLCCQVAFGQQLQFNESSYDSPGALFGRRYNDHYTGSATIEARGTFMLGQVHKISIYNKLDSLVYFFELDRQGKTIEEGYQGQYYFRTHRKVVQYQDTFECKIWRAGNKIMRKDTSEIYHKVYRNADTLMEYDEYNLSVFKRGKLINEQNDFYSKQYLNHPGSFKNDYDSTVLYLCSRKYYRSNFSASVINQQINLDTNSLKEHAFFKKYRRPAFYKHLVEGEEFVEPVYNFRACGTLTSRPEPYETLNEKGLFDKLYTDQRENVLIFYAKYEYYEKP